MVLWLAFLSFYDVISVLEQRPFLAQLRSRLPFQRRGYMALVRHCLHAGFARLFQRVVCALWNALLINGQIRFRFVLRNGPELLLLLQSIQDPHVLRLLSILFQPARRNTDSLNFLILHQALSHSQQIRLSLLSE